LQTKYIFLYGIIISILWF